MARPIDRASARISQPTFSPACRRRPKRLPPKHFYDAAGSRLFERITTLPEYYPTRTELRILADHAEEIAAFIPNGAALVEFGSGSSTKVRLLLDKLPRLAAYVPVDISAEFLDDEAARLGDEFPHLSIVPVAADFTRGFVLPRGLARHPLAGFFPGSTIGNFEPGAARAFLHLARRLLGSRAVFVVGVDLVKDRRILEPAYDDAAGVTAAFNLNVLARANRELGANFDLAAFAHRAFYDAERHRIEMHLVSRNRPDRARPRPNLRVRGRREHPHREQLQIHGRSIFAPRGRSRLAERRRVPGRRRPVLGPRPARQRPIDAVTHASFEIV